jgi:nicotinamidase-related amidase
MTTQTEGRPTADQLFDPSRTAVVIMDFQVGIVRDYALDPDGVTRRAAEVLAAARKAGIPVIHVRAEVGQYAGDGPVGRFRPEVAPVDGEPVVHKTKGGAFSTTGLDAMLREQGVDTLVLLGVATSGCVLSTVRWGADVGYRLVVVADACDAPDEEVHRVLVTKVFPGQAKVVDTAGFAAALA